MTTPENGRATSTGEPDGDRFLADLDAALQGHEPDGSHADTARFAAQLAGVLQSQAGSAPENLRQTLDASTAKQAVNDRKPSTVVRMDRALNRFRIGILDLAAIVALTVLGILIWRSLETPSIAKPEIKPADPEKRLAAEDAKPPAPDILPPSAESEAAWEKEIRERLEARISFNFADTPLSEVLAFFQAKSAVNIVIDPKVAAENALTTPVSLQAKDMTLGGALQWVLRITDLRMSLQNECVFISKRDFSPIEMRVFDVSELPISSELLANLLTLKFESTFRPFEAPRFSVNVLGNLLQVSNTRESLREVRSMITTLREQAPTGKFDFRTGPIPEWKKSIQQNLKKKVSFEFVDTPLNEVVEFLQKIADVNIVLDPSVRAEGNPPVNLRVADMDLAHAIEWVLRLADCSYSLENEALYITKAEQKHIVMVGYDISSIRKDRNMSVEDLRAAILNTVAPDSWDEKSLMICVNKKDSWIFVNQYESIQPLVESMLQKLANPEKP